MRYKMAQKEARAEKKLHRAAYGCRWCGAVEPIHADRRFQKSRGQRAPGFIIDTLECTNCNHTWTEMPGDKEAS